jgi:hypothetical protein
MVQLLVAPKEQSCRQKQEWRCGQHWKKYAQDSQSERNQP